MTVSAPAENTWSVDAIFDGAAEVLRLENADADATRLRQDAVAATQLIDVELDMVPVEVSEETPAFNAGAEPALVTAAVKLTVELYHGTAPEQDPVAVVRRQVLPWKARWGIA